MAKYQEIIDLINELKEGFGRIDERTINIWRVTEQQEKHLSELNGAVIEQIKQTAEQGKQVVSNKTHIWWIIRLLITAGVIGGGATGLIKWLG